MPKCHFFMVKTSDPVRKDLRCFLQPDMNQNCVFACCLKLPTEKRPQQQRTKPSNSKRDLETKQERFMLERIPNPYVPRECTKVSMYIHEGTNVFTRVHVLLSLAFV